MTHVATIRTATAMLTYRASLTGEILAWTIYPAKEAFSPVHRVEDDPERGPVIIVGNEVFEVDPEDEIYTTKTLALEAHFNR